LILIYDLFSSSGNGRLSAEEVRIAVRSVHVPLPDYLLNTLLSR
jgi:hypothetical protein